MTARESHTPDSIILHARAAAGAIRDEHFDPAWWRERGGVVGEAPGRGAVVFVLHAGETWALRHFYRGGWMARLSPDRYLWLGRERTRMWREWRMLAELRRRGLPVPEPVAARLTRSGLLYRGDLITRLIEGAETLARIIETRALAPEEWRAVGALLARFHTHGVRHDDINIRNVLRDQAGRFSLIDFDKARFAPPGEWRERNLARFHRSLEKLRASAPQVRFEPGDWRALREGYAEGASAP